MLELKRGRYFGANKRKVDLGDILITETTCGAQSVDWHYHEHPHFSYALVGHCEEKTKGKTETVIPGTLVYHDHQESHCNLNHSKFSRNFYLELNKTWFDRYGFTNRPFEGNHYIKDPFIKSRINQIYYESCMRSDYMAIGVESLLVQIFDWMNRHAVLEKTKKPRWVLEVDALIHEENPEEMSLVSLAQKANIHPVHLSRNFPKYFHTSLAQYIRRIKVQQSTILLLQPLSLTEIAYRSGFSDQSHFIRCFKSVFKMTPKKFRESILKG